MSKRTTCSLMLLLLFVSILTFSSGVTEAHHDPHHPDHPIEIRGFEPLGFYPGIVMSVVGGPFRPLDDEGHGSMVIFDGDETLTFFESPSRLIFVVPLYASCAPNHYVFVRSVIGDSQDHEIVETERKPVIVQCVEDRPYGPRPRIKEMIHSGHVTSGKERIVVKGQDILPFSPRDGYPHTLVHYTLDNVVGTEELTYHSFGEASFTLNVNRCGTYNVELRNYYIDAKVYVPSSDYDIEVTSGCDGIPAAEGDYEISLKDVPQSANVGVSFGVKLNIEFTGTYDIQEDLEIRVNGEIVDTQQITINAHSITEHPLNFRFDQTGTNNIEVKLGDATAQATVNVRGSGEPAGTSPAPPSRPGSSENLRDYDTDGDCYLSEIEYIAITDAWIAETISEPFFFSATDAWIEQTNVCTNSAGPQQLRVQKTAGNIVFSAGASTSSMGVQIFDAAGRVVFTQRAHGNRLSWALRDNDGTRVANGVYFAKVMQNTFDGVAKYDLKKIVVLR